MSNKTKPIKSHSAASSRCVPLGGIFLPGGNPFDFRFPDTPTKESPKEASSVPTSWQGSCYSLRIDLKKKRNLRRKVLNHPLGSVTFEPWQRR